VLQQPPLVPNQPLPPGALPPPGSYQGAPFPSQMMQLPAPIANPSGSVQAIAIFGTILGIVAWLLRVFADVGRSRRLWSGSFRFDAPLVLVAIGLVIACVLSSGPRLGGAGLAAGLLLDALAFNAGGIQARPTSSFADRVLTAALVLAAVLVLFAAVSGTGNLGAERKRVLPAGCLALAMFVVGQEAGSAFGFSHFGTWSYVAVAVGLALANRTGWLMAVGALAYSSAAGVLFLSLEQGNGRGFGTARVAELLCGIALAILCLVFALKPGLAGTGTEPIARTDAPR
jgi:hypothetical protein